MNIQPLTTHYTSLTIGAFGLLTTDQIQYRIQERNRYRDVFLKEVDNTYKKITYNNAVLYRKIANNVLRSHVNFAAEYYIKTENNTVGAYNLRVDYGIIVFQVSEKFNKINRFCNDRNRYYICELDSTGHKSLVPYDSSEILVSPQDVKTVIVGGYEKLFNNKGTKQYIYDAVVNIILDYTGHSNENMFLAKKRIRQEHINDTISHMKSQYHWSQEKIDAQLNTFRNIKVKLNPEERFAHIFGGYSMHMSPECRTEIWEQEQFQPLK